MGSVVSTARSVVVDTDVLLDHLRGLPEALSFLTRNGDRILIPAIVVAELHAGAGEGRDRETLEELLSLFPVAPLTGEVAAAAGRLQRDYGPSHGLGLADAVIAATAQAVNAELATRNARHFPMFPGLRPPYA